MTRRVVRRKKDQKPQTVREQTEGEKKAVEAWKRVREQMQATQKEEATNKKVVPLATVTNQTPAPQNLPTTKRTQPEGVAEGGSSQPKEHGKALATTKKQAQLPQTPQSNPTRPALRKKEKFEDTHKRMTTYFTRENHQKLKEVKEAYGIPITETINNALKEYFKKYSL